LADIFTQERISAPTPFVLAFTAWAVNCTLLIHSLDLILVFKAPPGNNTGRFVLPALLADRYYFGK
jgi:hypothetical protein